ncbi:MAG: hypothetical protein EZS28_039404, partial [Streblomastix strix]
VEEAFDPKEEQNPPYAPLVFPEVKRELIFSIVTQLPLSTSYYRELDQPILNKYEQRQQSQQIE